MGFGVVVVVAENIHDQKIVMKRMSWNKAAEINLKNKIVVIAPNIFWSDFGSLVTHLKK